jgi:hypothetical protein
LRLLFTTALLHRAGSVTGEALRTNPTAAGASPAGLIRCVGFRAKNRVTVEAGNLHARFLGQYLQIFQGSDVPHHFTGDDDPVLKGLFGHTGRHGSPCAREAAFNLRNPVDSAAVTASLVLDQCAVIKAGLNHFFYHETPPLMLGAGGAHDPRIGGMFPLPLASGPSPVRLRLIERPINAAQNHTETINANQQQWMHGFVLVQALGSLGVEEGEQSKTRTNRAVNRTESIRSQHVAGLRLLRADEMRKDGDINCIAPEMR